MYSLHNETVKTFGTLEGAGCCIKSTTIVSFLLWIRCKWYWLWEVITGYCFCSDVIVISQWTVCSPWSEISRLVFPFYFLIPLFVPFLFSILPLHLSNYSVFFPCFPTTTHIIASADEVMFLSVFVCRITQKLLKWFALNVVQSPLHFGVTLNLIFFFFDVCCVMFGWHWWRSVLSGCRSSIT